MMSSDTYQKVKKVLWMILFANLAVAVLKIAIGTAMNSTSVTADGFHSLTDGTSNIIGLIGIRLASKPIDKDHPYGHRKFETLAGLFISALLFLICGKIILAAVFRFINPVVPSISLIGFVVLLITIGINLIVCLYEYKKGRKLKSQILISDSMHTRSDLYVSVGVLATIIGIRLGMPPIIDPLASLVVSGLILSAAFKIFKDNRDVLVDKAAVDTEKIKAIADTFSQVKDTHNIRSRGCEGQLYIDMHIMTEPDMSVAESHRLIHNLEDKIQDELNRNVQVIAHVEPFRNHMTSG